MKRTFIAIEILPEPEFFDALDALKEELGGEELRWVPNGNFHLTLHFFGNTDTTQEAQIIGFLSEFSSNRSSVRVRLKGLNYFKRGSEPQVLYVSVVDDEGLQTLVSELREGLSQLGFPIDEKAFRPHLTLARMKHIRDKNLFVQTIKAKGEDFTHQTEIRQIIFYESVLKPAGPEYVPVRVFRLKE